MKPQEYVFIDPFTDYGFKRLFRWPRNKILLIDFLNSVISPAHRIIDINYLDTEQLDIFKENKKSVFDIYCEDEAGNIFIVELQRIREAYFKDRSLYYSAVPIRKQAMVGDWNYHLKQTICIGIMDFVFEDSDPSEMIQIVKLINIANGKVFNENLTFWYLEMPKFKKQLHELENRQEQWLFVLRYLAVLPEIPVSLRDDTVFKHLFMEARISNYSEEEAMAYMASMKERWDRYAEKETAKTEGEIEGRQAEKFATAQLMKASGEPVDKIAKYTGLTIEEIGCL